VVTDRERVGLGALYMLGSMLFFSLVSVGVKLSSRTMSDGMIVFFRNAGALLTLVPFLVPGGWGALKTSRIGVHLFRSLAGWGSIVGCFYALARMPLGDGMLLSYTSPLFVPFISSFWMKERPPRGFGAAVVLGFAGVALVMKPGFGMFTGVALAAVASGFCGALTQVGDRDLTRTEPVLRIVFYFSAVSTAVSAAPLFWSWRTPHGVEWPLLIGTGVLAAFGQLFLTKAYRHASPAHVGPLIYSAVAFAGLWDWLWWGRVPDGLSFVGAGLIFASGVFILRRSQAELSPIQ
jgi:drug/metabolite transporter (DMT)-like permease